MTTTHAELTPYLAVSDARNAIDWYGGVLSAVAVSEPVLMPDGRIGHAELSIAGARLYLSDEAPQIGVVAPQPGTGAAVTLHLETSDVDELFRRAVAAGAAVEREPVDSPYGRQAVIRDPFGHRWMLMSPDGGAAVAAEGDAAREGDVIYASLNVPDASRAAAFYGSVLGWRGAANPNTGTVHVVGHNVDIGIFTSDQPPTIFCCYVVDDLDTARSRVEAAGGQAGPVQEQAFGKVAECVDPGGRRFALWQNQPGYPRPALNGSAAGDLVYLTVEVSDSQISRDFYAAVLGWTFRPGHVADGWQVNDASPMTGLAGGRDLPRIVAQWRVDDIDAAVERVVAAGGSAEPITSEPYGRTATCVDDQGMTFYLAELSAG